MPLLVDAHQDISYNALTFGRDITCSAHAIRRQEAGTPLPAYNNGECTVGWPDYQRGRVAIICASLFAVPYRRRDGEWNWLNYRDRREAYQRYLQNLDYYHRLWDEHGDKFRPVRTRADLAQTLDAWRALEHAPAPADDDPEAALPTAPVGLVLTIEGGDGIRAPEEVYEWWEAGVRWIGPAWVHQTAYCGGDQQPGPLTSDGRALLDAMADRGFALDVSHMAPEAASEALDRYPGVIVASHANAAALLKETATPRNLTDRQIARLIERDAVIGIVPFNRFLQAGWVWGLRDGKQRVHLSDVAAHIDHICQIAGDARHVGIGSDFDGGFGWPGVPAEVDTIADLQQLAGVLTERGYTEADVRCIMGENWIRILEQVLPSA